ncbi:MAG TPA: AAA family ATPase [Candidatus Acidoferrum sp.]|jgi:general secretion pathway protein A|nr:AAA family ATPase [Candidatus Acidoferrum sp.]
MFLDFYNLREQPFGVTPDPRFLYFGSTHREALASLLYAVETKRGFSALVAEPGMGKTSLLFRMLESLRNSARTAFLFQTEGDSHELLRNLLHDLGIKTPSQDPGAMHEALNEGLLQELNAGRQVVVVIDEAQNLDEKVLETVRLLSNFETSTQKLMHIVLAGQPGLASKLSDTGMIQLRQRVSTIIHLEPFRRDDTSKYIEHRLRAAGHTGPPIFTDDALDMVARISQGIPRNINSMCFQALSIGFATQSKQIGTEVLHEVTSDLDFLPKRNTRASVRQSLPRPRRAVEPRAFPGSAGPAVWEYAASLPLRPSRLKWVAAIACFVILPISVIALSDSKVNFADTLPGRAAEQVVNAVLSSGDPTADFIPPWPARLKPPQPPPQAEAVSKSPTPSSPDDPQSPDSPSAVKTTEEVAETARAPAKIATRNYSTAAEVNKGRTFYDRRSEPDRPQGGRYATPTRVQVLRSQTLFQFALELYGQSNWKIVEAICAANPQVHGPFSVLSPGQWIQLPSDLVTVTANYNSRATIGRPR